MTQAGSIKARLESQWNLSGDLATSKLHFDEGWYDGKVAKPQLTVTELVRPPGHFFGSITVYHPRHLINCWIRIPMGAIGETEYGWMEDMVEEIHRILDRGTFTPFGILVPEDGRALHELDSTPRMLRYEVTYFTTWQP